MRRLTTAALALAAIILTGCIEDATTAERDCIEGLEIAPGQCAHVWVPQGWRSYFLVTVGTDEVMVFANDEAYEVRVFIDSQTIVLPPDHYVVLDLDVVGSWSFTWAPGANASGTVETRLPERAR